MYVLNKEKTGVSSFTQSFKANPNVYKVAGLDLFEKRSEESKSRFEKWCTVWNQKAELEEPILDLQVGKLLEVVRTLGLNGVIDSKAQESLNSTFFAYPLILWTRKKNCSCSSQNFYSWKGTRKDFYKPLFFSPPKF